MASVSIGYGTNKSQFEEINSLETMAEVLKNAQVIEDRNIFFREYHETLPYERVIDQVFYLLTHTIKATRDQGKETTPLFQHAARETAARVKEISGRVKHSTAEKVANCFGQIFCGNCCCWGYLLPTPCKVATIFSIGKGYDPKGGDLDY